MMKRTVSSGASPSDNKEDNQSIELSDNHNGHYNGRKDNDEGLRIRFVSRHRQTLDFIKTDSAESRTYTVPNIPDSSNGGFARMFDTWFVGDVRNRQSRTPSQYVAAIMPIWSWLPTYNYQNLLLKDIVAGLTVGFMVIPQSMSYAKLAGLPVEYGLYSAFVPVYAYALFGTSRQLAVGPVAIVSLLVSSGISEYMHSIGVEESDSNFKQIYRDAAIQLSFLVGLLYIVMGICRLGFVTIFLSHAVVSGFTTGAAVIIGMTQLKYIFGISIPRSDKLVENIKYIIDAIDGFNWRTFLLGGSAIAVLVICKNVGKHYPKLKFLRAAGPLLVTIIGIILEATIGFEHIPLVGKIPKGLPSPTIDQWSPIHGFDKLVVVVVQVTIVGFMESISIAKSLASRHKYDIDASKELIGLGMANFFGGMFSAYPVTGSFSRSAVNNDTGAETGVAGIVTATLVAFVLLLLTFIFEKVPMCILGAIVISGVLGLLNYDEAVYLWKVHRFDFLVWMAAFLGTMFMGVEFGLGISVALSLLIVLYESAYPHTAVLGRLPGTTVYRNIKQYPQAERLDGIVLMRVDGPLYFANAQNIRDKIRKYRRMAEEDLDKRSPGSRVKYLVLDMSPVSHIDTSALHILEDMNVNYNSRGQQLCFANPSLAVMQRVVASGLADKVGREHFFASTHDAVNWCLHEMDCQEMSLHESGITTSVEDQSSLTDAKEGTIDV